MKEPALIIIKPDGIIKGLVGNVLTKFSETNLDMVAIRIVNTSKELAKRHYIHLKKEPFFEDIISYLSGDFHKNKRLLAIIYYGENAIKECRKVAGHTNPEMATPKSIRGAYGRITTKGLFENIVHVSSDKDEAEREIKIWFSPDDIAIKLFSKKIKILKDSKKEVWK